MQIVKTQETALNILVYDTTKYMCTHITYKHMYTMEGEYSFRINICTIMINEVGMNIAFKCEALLLVSNICYECKVHCDVF